AAEKATMKKATAYLEERMASDVRHVTGGRYERVQVADGLAISLWSSEVGDWVPVERLSQGTIDQVYLAARIELVRLVTQDRRPPLVFDDPFVTYDDARATRAVELLRDLAVDHQILYLTTSDRYDAVADKVIELPEPAGAARAASIGAAATRAAAPAPFAGPVPEPVAPGGAAKATSERIQPKG